MTAPQEQKPTTEKQLRRARRMMGLSAALLVVSLVAIIASAVPEWAHLVVFLMWNHIAVMIVAGSGGWAARRLGAAPLGRVSPRLGELLAPWVLVLALVSAAVAIPNWGPSPWWDLGQASDGSAVSSHQWHSSGDRYFERINHGEAREITEAEYDKLQQRAYGSFARIWAVLSFGGLLTWRFIALRRRDLLQGHPSTATPPLPQAAMSAPGAQGGAGWRSTAVIAGIWGAVIGSNLLSLTRGPHRVFCSTPLPSEMAPILLVMPLLVIGIGAFWTKQSPFMTPWLASLIDQRLGAGGTDAFTARLRPLLLFSVTALIGSGALLTTCGQGDSSRVQWPSAGFLASTGVAMALAHVILRRRGIPGV